MYRPPTVARNRKAQSLYKYLVRCGVRRVNISWFSLCSVSLQYAVASLTLSRSWVTCSALPRCTKRSVLLHLVFVLLIALHTVESLRSPLQLVNRSHCIHPTAPHGDSKVSKRNPLNPLFLIHFPLPSLSFCLSACLSFSPSLPLFLFLALSPPRIYRHRPLLLLSLCHHTGSESRHLLSPLLPHYRSHSHPSPHIPTYFSFAFPGDPSGEMMQVGIETDDAA